MGEETDPREVKQLAQYQSTSVLGSWELNSEPLDFYSIQELSEAAFHGYEGPI